MTSTTDAAADDPRVLRVFISSTFRDMQAEREELVKRVFPQVRRMCEARGVTWAEVDLRWGVTDEQKAEGAVLPICLAEIERTRPYFIGLLGQRYGWVPDELPPALVDELGWLTEDVGRSVTELEILHGVLNDPDAAGHALFYLRDPAWVAGLPAAEQQRYLEDTPAGVERLDALRGAVRGSGHPVREYADPVALGELVLADLTALVEERFPDAEPPDPLDRAATEHRAFALGRFTGFVERPQLTGRLDAHAAGDGPPLLVTGEPGIGSSALVAAWAERWRSAHPRDVVVTHHVGASTAAADWRELAGRVIGELTRALALPGHDPRALAGDATAVRAELATALRQASAAAAVDGRRVVLVLDGVDRLVDEDGAPDLLWLSSPPPPGVRVVLTSGPGRPLEAALHRGWATLEVPPLVDAQRRELVATFLARFSKALDRGHVDRLVAAPLAGNPLFLRTVLDELRQHGDHFTLGEVIDHLCTAATVDDLLELVLARYERDFERDRPGLVRDVMTALWAARHGLAERELLELLGDGDDPLPQAGWSPLMLAAEQLLQTRSGLIGFATEHLRTAVEDRYLTDLADRVAAHARLAAYFAGRPLGDRVTDELVWQQLAAGDHDAAVATLSDLAYTEHAYVRGARDLRQQWGRLEAAGRSLLEAYRPVVEDPAAHVEGVHPTAGRHLVWGVARLLSDAGYPDESIGLHASLVATARRHPEGSDDPPGGDGRLRAALVNLGAALLSTTRLEQAEEAFAEAVARCRAAGDDAMLAAALGNLAMTRRERGALDDAEALFLEEEALCRRLDDPAGLQASLGNRAQLHRMQARYDDALACIAAQEQLCRDVADRVGVGRALAARAAVFTDLGQVAEARTLTEAFCVTCRELGDVRGLAEGMLNLASIQLQLGDAAAAATAAEAVALAARLGDEALRSRSLVVRATCLQQTGDWAAVGAVAGEAVAVARERALGPQLAMALGVLGTAQREQGQLAAARTTHEQELAAAAATGDATTIATAHANLGAAAAAAGRGGDALDHLTAAVDGFAALTLLPSLLPALANRAQLRHMGHDLAGAAADYAHAAEVAATLGLHDQVATWGQPAVQLAQHVGDTVAAARAWAAVAAAAAATGDDAGRQRALGEQALLLLQRAGAFTPGVVEVDGPLLDQATVLLDEQERLCRALGDQVGLAAAVGNRAVVLRHRGDLAGALACVQEQERIARASGNGQGVLFATANRGELLGLLGRTDEAREALTWARGVAAQHGLQPMVAQLDAMLAGLSPA